MCDFNSIGRVLVAGSLLLTAAFPSEAAADLELRSTESSPRGDILIKTYWDRIAAKNQVWLESAKDNTRKFLLYTYARSGSVVMSPDETMIAFNHNYASTDSTVVLFRKIDDIHYQPVDCDVETTVWTLFKSVYHFKAADPLDHTYVDCIGWSRDGTIMLVKTYGHGNGYKLGAWYCVVDVRSCAASTELASINRNAVEK